MDAVMFIVYLSKKTFISVTVKETYQNKMNVISHRINLVMYAGNRYGRQDIISKPRPYITVAM